MTSHEIVAGLTDQTIDVFIKDSSVTTGAGLAGLLHNTANLICYYRKGPDGVPTALALVTQTVGGAHSDGGFVAVDGTNCPGQYRLDLSDAIVATPGRVTLYLSGAANMAPCIVELSVVATDLASRASQSAVDSVKTVTDALTSAAAAKLARSTGEMYVGTIDNTVAPTTTVFEADDITEATADHFKGRTVIFTSGALKGQAREITAYSLVVGRGRFTVTAMTEAPANNDQFLII
jgi:hypothetical protein